MYYKWVWGDGTTTEWLGPYDSGEEAIASHSWNEKGIYDIKVKAMDSHDGISTWSDPTTITVENQPPNKPSITGPVSGKKGIIIEYIFTATDPDNNEVYYYIEWGDEEKEEWFGPYPSGQEVKVNHIWSKKGNYIIKAKAKDTHDLESDWEILEISMIKNKQSIKSYLPQLFEIFSEKWNFSLLNLIKYWV